jgi:hypothetical protein
MNGKVRSKELHNILSLYTTSNEAESASLKTYHIGLLTAFLKLFKALKKEEIECKLVKVSEIEFQ